MTQAPVPPDNRRRNTPVILPPVLLDEAEALGIDVSVVCEAHLQALVRQAEVTQWRVDYAAFIEEYNAQVERDGLPLANYRMF